jgi:hypothetical protein
MVANPYNGHSPSERAAKGRALLALIKAGVIKRHPGPCDICGARRGTVRHSENYKRPFGFEPPDTYSICRAAHAQIHLRFYQPRRWHAFLAHVRSGRPCRTFASCLRSGQIELFRDSISPDVDRPTSPDTVPHLHARWWETLSTDPRTLTKQRGRLVPSRSP